MAIILYLELYLFQYHRCRRSVLTWFEFDKFWHYEDFWRSANQKPRFHTHVLIINEEVQYQVRPTVAHFRYTRHTQIQVYVNYKDVEKFWISAPPSYWSTSTLPKLWGHRPCPCNPKCPYNVACIHIKYPHKSQRPTHTHEEVDNMWTV